MAPSMPTEERVIHPVYSRQQMALKHGSVRSKNKKKQKIPVTEHLKWDILGTLKWDVEVNAM